MLSLRRMNQEKRKKEVKDLIEIVEHLMEQILAEQGGDGAINTDKA